MIRGPEPRWSAIGEPIAPYGGAHRGGRGVHEDVVETLGQRARLITEIRGVWEGVPGACTRLPIAGPDIHVTLGEQKLVGWACGRRGIQIAHQSDRLWRTGERGHEFLSLRQLYREVVRF